MSGERKTEFDDMQGLVRFGHGHLSDTAFVLLQIQDSKAARTWIRSAPINSAKKQDQRPEQVMQLALTAKGLRELGLDTDTLSGFSEEFVAGMSGDENRSRRLGDVGDNAPANWQWGAAAVAEPHLLLMLYARKEALESWWDSLQSDEFRLAFELMQFLPASMNSNREHFGFIDGISQPDIDWSDQHKTGFHERDSYSNKLAAGEVVLGYRNEYGLYSDRPLLDPNQYPDADGLPEAEDSSGMRDLGRNGSYLVMRQLSQDAPAFWQFLDQVSDGNALQRERLAAAMVGRERSDGKPLVPSSGLNGFEFDEDPLGKSCPLGAHVRRANPRAGDFPSGVSGLLSRLIRTLGFGRRHPHEDLIASSRFHRILRRGRVYGESLSVEDALTSSPGQFDRGLHFVSLGANISRQFEFVQNAWIDSTHFAGLQGEADPLMGNRNKRQGGSSADQFSYREGNAPACRIEGLPQFVKLLGGAYFFMPGLRALQYLARDSE